MEIEATSSVADPESGAFLTPGSVISFSRSRILDPKPMFSLFLRV